MMKSSHKRSLSWPCCSTDKKEIIKDALEGSTNKKPQSRPCFPEKPNVGLDRRSSFGNLSGLISEELAYMEKDPKDLIKYVDALSKQLLEAQDELDNLKQMIKEMPDETPDDNFHLKNLRDELQKLKKRVTKLKAKFPAKVKIHIVENEAKKKHDELKKDTKTLTLLDWRNLSLPKFYCDPVFGESEIFGNFYSLYNELGNDIKKKLCLLCFSVFPKEAEIRRKVMIYWWMAEGFIDGKAEGTVFLETFSKMGFIIPISEKPRSHIHSYKLHPMARIVLMYLAQMACIFDFKEMDGTPTEKYSSSLQAFLVGPGLSEIRNLERLHMIFNLNESTLEFNPEWFQKMQNLNVLFLGRWQSNEEHHVEIENPEFLDSLKHLQFLKFLSLQGVSSVTKLPKSIMKLESLEMLDLRACHNLEVIPAGIGCLKNLARLDMSGCYLLDHMPRELSNLENLKVLMGFVVGDPKKKKKTKKKNRCTLKDLSRLDNLEKLGIYMSVPNFETEDLGALQKFKTLKTLSISWGSSKDRGDISEETMSKAQRLVDKALAKITEAPQNKRNEAPQQKRKEAPEKKKTDKRVRIKDGADESATSADQASSQPTTKQEFSQASKDGVEKSTGASETTASQKVDAVETSPGASQQASQTRKDEAAKSIGTIEEAIPEAIKDPVLKSPEVIEKATPQANNEQESHITDKGVAEKSPATTEQASPSKVKDAVDAEKLNSETNQQASPKIRKDEADNAIRTSGDTSNQEIKKEAPNSSGTVLHMSPEAEKYATEQSTEATEQTSVQTTNQQADHQTLKDVTDKSTETVEEASTQKEKKEGDEAVKTTEQEKPQAEKGSADAQEPNSAQADNSADTPENITKKKDQENEKNEEDQTEQKTTLSAPLGSRKGENEVESSKVVENNTGVTKDIKKTNSKVEGQGQGIVEDKESVSTPVVASKKEAEGEISRAIDDNTGISEDSKEKKNQENEGDGKDNVEYKKDSRAPRSSDKQNEGDSEKATEDKNQETKQGNKSLAMRTLSKAPKDSCLNRSKTGLGALLFHSGDQGSTSESSESKLPASLEKLQLVCYPELNAPDWLKPESLPHLTKLYISGGKLRDLGTIYDWIGTKPVFTKNTWKVTTLRLKYLNHMDMSWKELRHLFPKLVKMETVDCPKLTMFPCDGYGMWIDKEKLETELPQ